MKDGGGICELEGFAALVASFTEGSGEEKEDLGLFSSERRRGFEAGAPPTFTSADFDDEETEGE